MAENHNKIVKALLEDIEFAAAEGLPNVLCMSGNREKMSDDVGLENCAVGLKRVLKLAEEKKITVLMEGLNSKVNHKDYDFTSCVAPARNSAASASNFCTISITCRSWKATSSAR